MKKYRKQKSVRRALIWVIVLGILAGAAFEWADELVFYLTGQDMLEELKEDVAAFPEISAVLPTPGHESAEEASSTAEEQAVRDTVDRGPDGFPLKARQHVQRVTVQSGDTLFGLADRFDIHPNTIFWANTDILQDNVHLLQVGTELYILPVNGVYHQSNGEQSIAEIASLYGVTPGDILYSEYNQFSDVDSDYIPEEGLRIVVPGGRREYISWRAPIKTGLDSGSTNPEGTLHPGSCRQVYVGAGGVGNYINPVGQIAYRITTGFEPWHPGTDLAASYETPIYASETGVVVFAGWHRDGYGELIIIDHGEGWTTYYGHLSNRFVGCGDQITQGQLIGEMGMTGNSTGIHLHFEIRENDFPYNPRDFLELRDVRDTQAGN